MFDKISVVNILFFTWHLSLYYLPESQWWSLSDTLCFSEYPWKPCGIFWTSQSTGMDSECNWNNKTHLKKWVLNSKCCACNTLPETTNSMCCIRERFASHLPRMVTRTNIILWEWNGDQQIKKEATTTTVR